MAAITYTAQRGLSLLGSEQGLWMTSIVAGTLTSANTITDVSASVTPLSVAGSITKAAGVTGGGLMAYSGYSTSNYAHQAYNSSFDPGTGGFRVRFWLFEAPNTTTETIYERDSATTAQRVTITLNAAGKLVFTCDDNTTVLSVTSATVVDDSTWRYVECIYSAGTLSIYLGGALDASGTSTALLTMTNTAAVIRWGLSVAGTNPLTNGKLSLVGGSVAPPTTANIKATYKDEKHLFRKHSTYNQSGETYSFDLVLAAMSPTTMAIKQDNVSLGGQIETIVDRTDEEASITTDLMHRTDTSYVLTSQFNEFIYSTQASEEFTLDVYGTVASADEPQTYLRLGNSVSRSRQGDTDLFTSQFQVRET